MFHNDKQIARCCAILCEAVLLDDMWHVEPPGPTRQACNLMEDNGGPLSSGERVMLLASFDFWNGRSKMAFADVFKLDNDNLYLLGSLLVALAEGADAVDAWIEENS